MTAGLRQALLPRGPPWLRDGPFGGGSETAAETLHRTIIRSLP